MLLQLAAPREEAGGALSDIYLLLSRYKEANAHFACSREQQLIEQLLAAAEERDTDAFAAAVAAYDNINKLSPWRVHMLLHIKNSVASTDEQRAAAAAAAAAATHKPTVGVDGEVDLS